MIAITIALFLVVGLVSLLVSNVVSRSELDKSSRQIESGRYATQLMSEDLQSAGYLGSSGVITSVTPVIPNACPAAVADLGYVAVASPGASSISLPLYGLSAAPGCISNVMANTAMIVVSRVDTSPVTTAAPVAAETYLQVSNCSTDAQPFVIGAGNPVSVFILKKNDCATPEVLRKVIQHVYYVSTCDVCTGSGADTTPTLKMAEYVNGAMTITPLTEGIESLQFDYGVDMNGDGAPDCYTSNPTSPPAGEIAACKTAFPAYVWTDATTNWSNVMAVRVHVLARNTETSSGWSDTRQYDMGLAKGLVGPFGDATKRHVYSAVVRLYNPAGQRETP
jgi:type IV pilus assembly protein PilW